MREKALLEAYNKQKDDLPPILRDSVSCVLFQSIRAVDEVTSSKTNEKNSSYEPLNRVIVGNKVMTLPTSGPNAQEPPREPPPGRRLT